MCLVYSLPRADECMNSLTADERLKLEGRLAKWADTANTETSGVLDEPRIPPQFRRDETLRQVRKYRRGWQRVFVCGSHRNCEYTLLYVVTYKRSEQEKRLLASRAFHNQLTEALGLPAEQGRLLALPVQAAEEDDADEADDADV